MKAVRLSRTDGTETIKRTLFTHDTSAGSNFSVMSVSWAQYRFANYNETELLVAGGDENANRRAAAGFSTASSIGFVARYSKRWEELLVTYVGYNVGSAWTYLSNCRDTLTSQITCIEQWQYIPESPS